MLRRPDVGYRGDDTVYPDDRQLRYRIQLYSQQEIVNAVDLHPSAAYRRTQQGEGFAGNACKFNKGSVGMQVAEVSRVEFIGQALCFRYLQAVSDSKIIWGEAQEPSYESFIGTMPFIGAGK